MTTFRVGAATHVGQIRSNNQDSKLVFDEESVFAVADGMGGHQGGEVASAIAVETLEAVVSEPTTESLVAAVKEANRRIISRATDTTSLRGMGTTLVAIALVNQGRDDEEVAWVNVGDSRVYLLRDGELSQLSQDHSLVEDLRRGGQLSDEEAAVHPQRNILTRALGIDREVEVDSGGVMPLLDDRFLLCSDGLFNEVDRDGIIGTLASYDDPTAASEELVRRANEGGGRDNITCVVVDVTDDGGRAKRAAALAAEADARRQAAAAKDGAAPAAEGGDVDEVDIDTVETIGAGTTEPTIAAEATDEGGAGDDGTTSDQATDDDPTPPNGIPLPPPPPPTAASAEEPTEPATIDPDGEAEGHRDGEAEHSDRDGAGEAPPAGSAAFINPGFPTADGDEQTGSGRFINPGFPTAEAAPDATGDDALPFDTADAVEYQDPDAGNRSHRTRILAGVAIVVVGLAVVAGALTWYGGQGHFIAIDGDTVAIYEGKPGGFLWVEPSLVATTDVTLADAAAADERRAVIEKRTFSSLGAARAFLAGIEEAAATAEDEAEAARSTTTTEATTTASATTDDPGASTTSPGQQAQTSTTSPGQ